MSGYHFEELKKLKRLFRRSRLLPGPGTKLEQTASGIRIHTLPSGSGTAYRGFCKVAPLPEQQQETAAVMIFDGTPDYTPEQRLSEYAGYAVINDEVIPMPYQELNLTGERGLISAQFTLSGTGVPAFDRYFCSESMPVNSAGISAVVLASYTVTAQRLQLLQQHTGVIYSWMFLSCDEVAQ